MGAIRTTLEDTWAGDIAQPKKVRLPCKHEELSLILRSHVKLKQKVVWRYVLETSLYLGEGDGAKQNPEPG